MKYSEVISMVKERVFTLETRLNNQDAEYFRQYIGFYCKVYREVWQDYIHGGVLSSKYVTKICHKHNLMKRTVNSIVRDIKGRYHALKELQKQQCDDLRVRLADYLEVERGYRNSNVMI